MTRHVVIAGGTGEVGRQLLALMADQPDLSVRALVRRPGSTVASPNIQEVPFDYEDATAYGPLFSPPCDLLLIALGTTRAKAGSDEAFLRVDRDYPLRLLSALAATHPEAPWAWSAAWGRTGPRALPGRQGRRGRGAQGTQVDPCHRPPFLPAQ